MPRQPWANSVKSFNAALASEGITVGGQRIKLKVRSRLNADGSRLVDAVGMWNPDKETVTTRSTDISICEGDYAVKLPQAFERTKELATAANAGADTKQARSTRTENLVSSRKASPLALKIAEAKSIIDERTKLHLPGRKCGADQYERHIRHLRIIESFLAKAGRGMTMDSVCDALLDHYQDPSKKNYKDAVVLFRGVLQRMGISTVMPDEKHGTYMYAPKDRAIPSDAVIAKRLMAITDPYERQLIYACVGYGRRNSEIWHADWDNLQEEAPWKLPCFAPKNGKTGVSWIIPFGNEKISMKGFRPPEWEECNSVFTKATGPKKEKIKNLSRSLGLLIRNRLGCEATDLRHRWGIVGLTSPKVKADPMTLAKAMCTSYQMFENTYTKELHIFQMADFNPMAG